MLGYYKHNKSGNIYEVIAEATNCTNTDDGVEYVVYCDETDVYVRELAEFKERFKMVEPLDTQVQLLVETLRMCKSHWDTYSEGAGFEQNVFKYIVGDKVSLAMTFRVINKKSAEKLISWINTW